MAFLDFLKKKPVVASNQPAVGSTKPSPAVPSSQSESHLELPELPSFDAAVHSDASHDLPPLPSFEEQSMTSAPPSFSLPEMPTFEDARASAPTLKEPATMSSAREPQSMMAPAPMQYSQKASAQEEAPMRAVDARTPYGPVFCDVETYRAILTNMSHAKDEVIQLQSFAEHGLQLQQKTQVQYDEFHNTLSNMAKKLLLAEAKLFR